MAENKEPRFAPKQSRPMDCACPSPRIHMLNINPNVMEFVGEAFEKWLGQESWILMNEISTLEKKPQRVF